MRKTIFNKKISKIINDRRAFFAASLVTFVTFLFGDYCKSSFQDISSFLGTSKSSEYVLLDLYESFESGRKDGIQNPHVVIVQDDKCNREQLAYLLKAIDRCAPAIIGIDHVFENNTREDSMLIESINNCNSPIVLGAQLMIGDEKQNDYSVINKGALETFLPNVSWGFLNLDLPNASLGSVKRDCLIKYSIHDSIEVSSFAFELARKSRPEILDKDKIMIYYRGLSTLPIDWKRLITTKGDIIYSEALGNALKGKIVIIGSRKDPSDYHVIPSGLYTPGVDIHAASVYTFIKGNPIIIAPRWLSNIISIILVFAFALLLYYATKKMSYIGCFLIRITQTLLILIFITIGYGLCHGDERLIYIDFSQAILMVGISSFMFDLLRGIKGILIIISNRLS